MRVSRTVGAAWVLMAGALLFPSAAKAQTSWGIAVTGDGTLYFCDIQRDRVWSYSAADGLSVVLDHNHCHTQCEVIGVTAKARARP